MKQKFLKYFSLVALILAVAVAPAWACVCVEQSDSTHASCSEQAESQSNNQQAQEKEPCCEFKGAVNRSAAQIITETAPLFLFSALVPKFDSFTFKVSFETLKFFPYPKLEGPPLTYLKNHSFLL